MPHHEIKHCPRCGSSFECKMGNITECHCTQVTLTPEQSATLERTYNDCLCGKCLREIQTDQE